MLENEIKNLANKLQDQPKKHVHGKRVIELTLAQAGELLKVNAGVFLHQQDGSTVF